MNLHKLDFEKSMTLRWESVWLSQEPASMRAVGAAFAQILGIKFNGTMRKNYWTPSRDGDSGPPIDTPEWEDTGRTKTSYNDSNTL